jgi:hypothetical protein
MFSCSFCSLCHPTADIQFTLTVSRTIGGTFLITAAQSGFLNQIIHKLSSTAPTVDPALVTETGATTLRENFSGAELNGVLHAYVWGIKVAFAITIAACGITVITSVFTKWTNIHHKKQTS